jgi:hypothetical protein
MLKLTSQNVKDLFQKVLFNDGEDTTNHVPVQGITVNVGLHPGRLEEIKPQVKELLEQLPQEFHKGHGGGTTFMSMPALADGSMWGEQRDAQELLLMGLATGYLTYCLPREMWMVLPGGVPYVVFDPNPKVGE